MEQFESTLILDLILLLALFAHVEAKSNRHFRLYTLDPDTNEFNESVGTVDNCRHPSDLSINSSYVQATDNRRTKANTVTTIRKLFPHSKPITEKDAKTFHLLSITRKGVHQFSIRTGRISEICTGILNSTGLVSPIFVRTVYSMNWCANHANCNISETRVFTVKSVNLTNTLEFTVEQR